MTIEINRDHTAIMLSVSAIILWFVENASLGWNLVEKSGLEKALDFLVFALIVLAYFVRPTKVIEKTTEIHTENITFVKPNVKVDDKK